MPGLLMRKNGIWGIEAVIVLGDVGRFRRRNAVLEVEHGCVRSGAVSCERVLAEAPFSVANGGLRNAFDCDSPKHHD